MSDVGKPTGQAPMNCLVDSLDHEGIRAVWIEEAHRRRDEVLKGQVLTIPADEVLARVRSRLKRQD